MANPLEQAHKQAMRDGDVLAKHFDRFLGNVNHPRGRVLSTYRSVRREMSEVLKAKRPTMESEVTEVLSRLQVDLIRIGAEALGQASNDGIRSAQRQAIAYVNAGADLDPAQELFDPSSLMASWLGPYETQRLAVQSVIQSGGDLVTILGDQARLGILQPAPVQRNGSSQLANALALGLSVWLLGRRAEHSPGVGFQKQAIAAVDKNTTDTCLRANGQIKDLDDPFKLTGTPRFADEQQWSPFHWYCRTSVALYLPGFDDALTKQLREQSRKEQAGRT